MLKPATCKNILGTLNIRHWTPIPDLLQYHVKKNFTAFCLG